MPSFAHEFTVDLLRRCPALTLHLLAALPGIKLPPYASIQIDDSDLSRPRPMKFSADLVLVLRNGQSKPMLALVIEVQRRVKSAKKYSWPVYGTTERARWRCPVWVLVVTDSPQVARWAGNAIDIGPKGSRYFTVVIGPEEIPRIIDAHGSKSVPELGVLSAITHGNQPGGIDVVLAALDAARGLDEDRRMYYHDAILALLGQATRQLLEETMYARKFEYRSDFARTYYAQGKTEGVAQGRAEGVAQGRAEGVAQGRAEGVAQGRAEAVLAVLKARDLRVSASAQKRILRCTDLGLLDRWLARAAHVATTAALFEEPDQAPPARRARK